MTLRTPTLDCIQTAIFRDGLAYDVSIVIELVAYRPAYPGRWQGEIAHRSPPEREQFAWRMMSAAPDDPDEPPLTDTEIADLHAWFGEHHDRLTETASDNLRGEFQ